jgi:hypothetical protein
MKEMSIVSLDEPLLHEPGAAIKEEKKEPDESSFVFTKDDVAEVVATHNIYIKRYKRQATLLSQLIKEGKTITDELSREKIQ